MRLSLSFAVCGGLLIASAALRAGAQAGGTNAPRMSAREVFYSAEETVVSPGKATTGAPSPPRHALTKPAKKTSAPNVPAGNQTLESNGSTPEHSAGGGTVELTTVSDRTYPALGLKYSVFKVGDDFSKSAIDSDTVFHSNDHIELNVEVSSTAYLYVVNRGSSGRWSTLFPGSDADQSAARVEPHHVYAIPPGNVISFADPAGKEELFLFLSRQPIRNGEDLMLQLSNAGKTTPAKAPQAEPGRFAHEDTIEAFNRMDDSAIAQLRSAYSRDLVVEKMHGTETPSATTPNAPAKDTSVYVVDPSGRADAHVVTDIKFSHE